MTEAERLAVAERAARDATACIYQPHHPDALRDGLLRGFWVHRRGADEKSARSLAGDTGAEREGINR